MLFVFLEKHRAYRKFIKNIKGIGEEDSVDDYIEERDIELLIAAAFEWTHTQEGVGYWSDLDKKWNKHIK